MMFASSPIRRRLRVVAAGFAAAVAVVGFTACSSGESGMGGGAGAAATEINIISWEGYHAQEWLDEYESETGVTVNVELTDTVANMFAKVQANPDAYDLALVTSGWVENYVDAGLAVPFDTSKITNQATTLTEMDLMAPVTYENEIWGYPYNWGTEPLVINPAAVTETPNSWDVLWDSAYAGRVSMLDDPTTQLPAIALDLGVNNPYNMTEAEFEAFTARLQELRPQLTHVAASIADQTNDFVSGAVDLGVLYNINTYVGALDAGVQLQIVIPEEGVAGWTDSYVITPAGEAKGDVVYDFVDYTMAVGWQARMAAEIGYNGNMSLEAAQSEDAIAAGFTQDKLERTELLIAMEDPEYFSKVDMLRRVSNLEEWLSAWNEFKLSVG